MTEEKQNAHRPARLRTVLADAFDVLQRRYVRSGAITGTSTGFSTLDELTNGLQEGELILLASRPGMGKTALALNIASRTALSGSTVYVHSAGFPPAHVALHLIAMEARVDMDRVRTGQLEDEDWRRISQAIRMLKDAPIFIGGAPHAGLRDLCKQLKGLVHEHELGLVVIDNLEDLAGQGLRGKARKAKEQEVLSALKLLALQCRSPVLLLSGLRRKLEERRDKRPILTDIRSFHMVQAEIDTVVFLHREACHGNCLTRDGRNSLAEVIVPLQGNGNPPGKVTLGFDSECLRFEDRDSAGSFASTDYHNAGKS